MTVDIRVLAYAALLVACATTTPQPATQGHLECHGNHAKAPDELKHAIVDGMRPIKNEVGACFDHYKQFGMVVVSIDVAADGTLEQVHGDGDLAGTEEARCIESAARKVRLPASREPYSICYPYVLR